MGGPAITTRPKPIRRGSRGEPIYWETDAEYVAYAKARDEYRADLRARTTLAVSPHCLTCTCAHGVAVPVFAAPDAGANTTPDLGNTDPPAVTAS